MVKLQSILLIIRPLNLFILLMTCVLVAIKSYMLQEIGATFHQVQQIFLEDFFLLAFIGAAVFGAAGSYIINDIEDVEIDKVNRPERALPSGIISIFDAKLYYAILVFLSFLCSLVLYSYSGSFSPILVVILFNTSFWVYAKFLKKTVLLGNIFVSLSSAFMVPVMAWAVPYKLEMGMNTNQLIFSVVFASFAFLVSLAREVVKDWQDMEGDIKENAKTFPIVWGESKTILLTLVLLFKVVVLSSAIIYFHELFPNGKVFASYQLFFVAIPSIFISFKFINNTEELNPKDLSKWLKMLMMSGMVSMILF